MNDLLESTVAEIAAPICWRGVAGGIEREWGKGEKRGKKRNAGRSVHYAHAVIELQSL
jgi:hypothetical protein